MPHVTTLQVKRHEITTQRLVTGETPSIVDGQIVVAVDEFAVTANNVTYAAFGDAMAYWNFFPTGDAEWGIVPVWGFGNVVESRCDGITVGERIYGYFPMSTHVVMQPTRVAAHGFTDGIEHRAALHAVYNAYLRVAADPAYDAGLEAEQMLLRPLFTTSFLIDDFLGDNDLFGSQQIVLSSASSKTAYGAAFALHQRADLRVVGLTSAANVDFVEALGCYDEVRSYDDVAGMATVPSVYVDMAGSAPVRLAVHTHLGDALRYSCSVGGTHWDEIAGGGPLPGPKPTLFFAPAQVAKRTAEWGQAGFSGRLSLAWSAFLAEVTSSAKPWMTVERRRGPAAVGEVLASHVDGTASPAVGSIVSMNG